MLTAQKENELNKEFIIYILSAVTDLSLLILQLEQSACWKQHTPTYIETPVQ
jgi:hypothetical protein